MRNLNKILLSIVFLGCLVSIFLSSVSLANGGLRDWIRDDTINNFLYCNDPSHVGRQGTESGINYTCVDTPGLGWQRVSAEASVNFQPVAGFGRSCTTNWGDCGPNGYNLGNFQGLTLKRGSIGGDWKMENVAKKIKDHYGKWDNYTDVSNNVCLDKSVFNGEIIPHLKPAGNPTSDLQLVNGSEIFIRACPVGTFASEAYSNPGGVSGSFPTWACCPQGWQAASASSALHRDVQGQTYCCPINEDVGLLPPGGVTVEFFSTDNNIGNDILRFFGANTANAMKCKYNNGTERVYSSKDSTVAQLDEVKAANTDRRYGLPIGFSPAQNPDTGNRIGVSGVTILDNNQGSVSTCASRNGCTLLTDNRLVRSDRLYNEFGLECERCYEEGEAMGLDRETREVLICDPSSPDLVKKSEAVADDITLTRSCLNSGSPGTAGFDSCKSCIEQGGVWIALGCFDPTPLGVITGIIRIVFGVAGGIALLLIIQAGLMYMGGKEGEIEKARKQLIALFTGLAVIIFSILILRVIGINVLDVLPVGSV